MIETFEKPLGGEACTPLEVLVLIHLAHVHKVFAPLEGARLVVRCGGRGEARDVDELLEIAFDPLEDVRAPLGTRRRAAREQWRVREERAPRHARHVTESGGPPLPN